jgi:glucose-1-phosphate thymidylyltransferase
VEDAPVALVVGDNIFVYYGHTLSEAEKDAVQLREGEIVHDCHMNDPGRYGVIEFDSIGKTILIEERPKAPKSHWAAAWLYFNDNDVVRIAKSLRPSARSELESTDVNRTYLEAGKLTVEQLGRGFTWLDTGTHESLMEASEFFRAIEHRQGLKNACLEEIAFSSGWILGDQVRCIGQSMRTIAYGKYLLQLLQGAG